MNRTEIAAKTAAYLETFLEKEGFLLLKTEYVTEDGVNYLRAYLDLTDTEKAGRKEALRKQAEEEESTGEEIAGEKDPGVPEIREAGDGPAQTGRKADGAPDEDLPEAGGVSQEPGIGINDCARVSRRLSKWLDREDFIPDEYILEVCSKGYLNTPEENAGDL